MEIIALIIGTINTIGGLGYLVFFKAKKRSENADATGKEIRNASDCVDLYQKLLEKHEKLTCLKTDCETRIKL